MQGENVRNLIFIMLICK